METVDWVARIVFWLVVAMALASAILLTWSAYYVDETARLREKVVKRGYALLATFALAGLLCAAPSAPEAVAKTLCRGMLNVDKPNASTPKTEDFKNFEGAPAAPGWRRGCHKHLNPSQ